MTDNNQHIQPEIRLIEILKGVLSKELGENISNKKLGSLLLSTNRFNRTIREKSKFRNISIDRIEEKIKLLVNNRENLNIALNGLKSYRVTRGYINIEDAKDWPEFILIKKIQTIFHKTIKELLPFSNLGKLFGSKQLFNEVITSNCEFRNITINRIEQKLHDLLEEPFLSEALEALLEYRTVKGYLTNIKIQNQEEIEVIKILQDLYSNELGYLISYNELSKKFGSRLLLNDTSRKGTKFTKLTLERMQNSIEKELSNKNKLTALEAIETYKKLKNLTIYDSSINQPEIELIKDLRNIFSPQAGSLISVNELTTILYPKNRNLLHFALKNQTVFMNSTIDEMIKNIKLNLTEKNLELATQVLEHYKTLERIEKKIENFNAESKLNEEICRSIFQELFHPLKFPTVSIHTFPWLIGPKGGPMHIDGYNVRMNLGFEYNGIQHYKLDNLYNKIEADLLYMKQKDSHKSKLTNKHKVRVITIPYTVKINERINYIIEECRKLNIRIPEGRINIVIKDIEKKVRERIKNRVNEKQDKKHENSKIKPEKTIQNKRFTFTNNFLRKENIENEDFSDPYLWFSPQVREAIHLKAEMLTQQIHEDVSAHENFSDQWEDISIYDNSDLESKITEEIIDNPDVDIIPDQDLEPDPEVSEIQESQEADDINNTITDEEVEDQINDLEQINEPEKREVDLRPDDFDPVNEPPYDPISQPVTEIIPPSDPPAIPDNVIPQQQKNDPETQESPQSQREQEEDSQIPEKSQDQEGTEQSNEHDQIPELGESEPENLSDKSDLDQEDSGITNQDEGKDLPNLDENDEDSAEIDEEKEDIGNKEEEAKDEKKEKDDKDKSNDNGDEKKDDKDNEQSKEDEEDSKEGEEESDNDDMDDFEEEPENGFNPEDIYDPINVIDYSEICPQITSFQSSNLGPLPIEDIDFTDNFGEKDNLPGINDCIDNFGEDRDERIPIDGFNELTEKEDKEDNFDYLT